MIHLDKRFCNSISGQDNQNIKQYNAHDIVIRLLHTNGNS